MKAYIAGKLRNDNQREYLEKLAKLCEDLGLDTFLPHRDVGLANGIDDVKDIFEGDIVNGFKDIDLVVAVLDGVSVGAGTAWELGYAYAKGISSIGIKTDESVEEGLDYLSAIIVASTPIVSSLEELKEKIKELI